MLTPITVAVKTAVVALGLVVVGLAARAARRTGSPALRGMTVGLAAIAVGGALGGGLDRLLGLRLAVGTLLGGLLTLAGFAVLVRSLYVDGPQTRRA